jgi:type I restriction enzyme, S subunit
MIPDGWKRKNLGEIADISSGSTPLRQKDKYWNEGTIPWVTTGEIDYQIIESAKEKITEIALKECSLKIYDPGTILMAMYGQGITRGRIALLGISAATNQACCAITVDSSADTKFIYFQLEHLYSEIRKLGHGGNQQNLNGQIIKQIPIMFPPLSEQCKIAEMLGVWDESIDLLERLIGRVRSRKQGLMQHLLTGKKRFKEFEGSEWKKVKLIEVAEVIVSPVDKLTVDGETSILLCNYTHVYHNIRITKALNFMIATATEKEIAKFTLRKGDVIITKDSETPNDIAIPAYVSEDLGNVVCGYHLSILRPRETEIDGEYLSYLLSISEIKYYFFTLANGATRFGLSVGSIEKAQFKIPPLPEQEKIAAVLSAADDEISMLEKQLAAYKQQKLGLMQQLLTGKIRVGR